MVAGERAVVSVNDAALDAPRLRQFFSIRRARRGNLHIVCPRVVSMAAA
jgi:hypothetical protein